MKHVFATLLILGLLLFSAVSGYSQSAEDAESKGESAQKNGDLDLAIANFSEAIRLDPKFTLAYNNRGLAYCMKGKLDNAIADFSEAIRLDPKLALAYNRRADAYDAKRNYDKAIADSNEAIRLDPKSAAAYSDRANLYTNKGDYDKAIADSNEAIRLDPKCARAYNALGIAYDGYAKEMLRADAEAAEALFARASKNFDGPPRKLDAVQQQVSFDGSVENFRASTRKLDSAHKAQLLFDYSGAAFKTAIDNNPDYDFGNNNLGVYYARRGGPEDIKLAEKYFRDALRSNNRYADAFNNLGIVLARQGKLDEAIASHKAGLKLRNERASDHNNLCRVYMQKGDLQTHVKENAVSLKCDPNFLGAWMSRAEIRIKQNDLDKAAKSVEKMIDIDPKSPETLHAQFMLATKYIELNRLDDAIFWLEQVLKVNKSAAEAYDARGRAYLLKGDLNRAQQDFEQILRIHPDYPGAKERLNAIRAQLANPKK